MPLDAGDERWLNEKLGRLDERLDRLDKDVGHLFVAAQEISIKLNVMDERLRATEGRNKLLWGVSISLALLLVASLISQASLIGGIDASVKGLAAEYREHARQTNLTRPEPVK